MNILALSLLLAAFCCICLGSLRYAALLCKPLGKQSLFRGVGWALLVMSLAASIAGNGLSVGITLWLGLVSLAAVLLMLALAYRLFFRP